ncbi:hypothetical protein [Brevibacillus porteri]|uniref:hypothetical protein n=1 Tax=Brevibacillus porteri TaxID=2126350 RepID=UPI003D227695
MISGLGDVLRDHGVGLGKKKAYTDRLDESYEVGWTDTMSREYERIFVDTVRFPNEIYVAYNQYFARYRDASGLKVWEIAATSPKGESVHGHGYGKDGYLYVLCKTQFGKIDTSNGAVTWVDFDKPPYILYGSTMKTITADEAGNIYCEAGEYWSVFKYSSTGKLQWIYATNTVTSNTTDGPHVLKGLPYLLYKAGFTYKIDLATGVATQLSIIPINEIVQHPTNPKIIYTGGMQKIDSETGVVLNYTTVKLGSDTPGGTPAIVGEYVYVPNGTYGLKLKQADVEVLSVFFSGSMKAVNSKGEFYYMSGTTLKKLRFFSKIR